jgi:hypothetical protein
MTTVDKPKLLICWEELLFPERMRLAVVLGAFVGLRLAEACGHRVGMSTSCERLSIPRSSTRRGR